VFQQQRLEHRTVAARFICTVAANGGIGAVRERGKEHEEARRFRPLHLGTVSLREGFARTAHQKRRAPASPDSPTAPGPEARRRRSHETHAQPLARRAAGGVRSPNAALHRVLSGCRVVLHEWPLALPTSPRTRYIRPTPGMGGRSMHRPSSRVCRTPAIGREAPKLTGLRQLLKQQRTRGCCLARAMRRMLERADLPRHFTMQSLRHSFCSLLVSSGVSPVYLQQQAGHADLGFTVRVSPETLEPTGTTPRPGGRDRRTPWCESGSDQGEPSDSTSADSKPDGDDDAR
jgi:hypothetical protein